MNTQKIAIGTVQFGLDYGIANSSGQVVLDEAKSILEFAADNNITLLDTASAYGESETVLGQITENNFEIVTKLSEVPADATGAIHDWCSSEIEQSMLKLNTRQLYAVLLHRPLQLLESYGDDLFQSLEVLKHSGLVKKIGISVSSPSDLDSLCDKYEFDLVQIPFNILDQRWDYWLHKLNNKGVEIHARSIFLQGLLLMSKKQRPDKFKSWDLLWDSWDNWLTSNGITAVEACLKYVLSVPQISKVIIGVESKKQLEEILQSSRISLPSIPNDIQIVDDHLLNPANWNTL